jgi:hypothetical protein
LKEVKMNRVVILNELEALATDMQVIVEKKRLELEIANQRLEEIQKSREGPMLPIPSIPAGFIMPELKHFRDRLEAMIDYHNKV